MGGPKLGQPSSYRSLMLIHIWHTLSPHYFVRAFAFHFSPDLIFSKLGPLLVEAPFKKLPLKTTMAMNMHLQFKSFLFIQKIINVIFVAKYEGPEMEKRCQKEV